MGDDTGPAPKRVELVGLDWKVGLVWFGLLAAESEEQSQPCDTVLVWSI